MRAQIAAEEMAAFNSTFGGSSGGYEASGGGDFLILRVLLKQILWSICGPDMAQVNFTYGAFIVSVDFVNPMQVARLQV